MKKLLAIVSLILCLVPISGADPGYTGNVGEARLGNHWVVTPAGFFNYQTNNPDFIGAVNSVVTNGGGGGVNLLPLNNVWTGSNSFTGPVVGTFTDTAGNPYPTLGLLLGGSVNPSFNTLSAVVVNSSLFFGPYRFPNGNLLFDNADTTNAVPPNSAVSVSATNWIPGAIAASSTNDGSGAAATALTAAMKFQGTNAYNYGLLTNNPILATPFTTNSGTAVTNIVQNMVALNSTNDASGAAKQATNGLGNAAFTSTNTMKVFAATNADLATLATTATTASAVSVTDTNNLVFQSGLAIKGSNYVFQATFSGLNGATGSVSIINGVLSLTLGTSNQFTPANLATLASALQAGSTLNGANLSAGTVADVALASTFLKTVPVGATNWIPAAISASISASNLLNAAAFVGLNGATGMVSTVNGLLTVTVGTTNQFTVANAATLASALQAGSTLNGANLTAGSVADSALASTFLKTAGNASTNNAAAQNWSGIQNLTNTGNTISGNGGGLTNTPSSFVPYVGGDWAATFTMASGGQSFFTPNGGGNQSPVGSDVNARTDCDGFSYATNLSLTLNTSGGGFQVNTNYVAYMITNSVSSSNAMSAIISGLIASSTFPRNISMNSISMIGVTNFTFVLYYIGSGGGASGTTRARISVQLVQTH